MPRTYTVSMVNQAITTGITLIQVKPGISSVRLRRAKLTQSNIATSTMQRVALGTSTGAATVTSATPRPHDGDGAAAKAVGGASATGVNASGEGASQTDIITDSFNLLNGWEKILTDSEVIEIPGGGSIFLYMRLPSAPGGSTTFDADLTFEEIG